MHENLRHRNFKYVTSLFLLTSLIWGYDDVNSRAWERPLWLKKKSKFQQIRHPSYFGAEKLRTILWCSGEVWVRHCLWCVAVVNCLSFVFCELNSLSDMRREKSSSGTTAFSKTVPTANSPREYLSPCSKSSSPQVTPESLPKAYSGNIFVLT